jgi:YVTN family beta-propeller protein
MLPTRSWRRLATIALAPMAIACSSPTEGGRSTGKHPAGIIAANVAVGSRPFGIALSGSTAIVTQLDAAQLVRIDVSATRVLDSIRVGSVPTGVAYINGASAAAVTNQFDSNVGFIDLSTRQQTATVNAPSTTFRVLVSPTGKHAYATASVGSLGVISLPSHAVEASVTVGGAPNGLALAPDGGTLYVTAMSGDITVINTASNTVSRTFHIGGTLQDVAVSPDGTELYVADEYAGVIHVLESASGSEKTAISLGASAFGLAITPDGKQLYATSPSSGNLFIIDRSARAIVNTINLGGLPRRIAFDETGRRAVVSNESGFVTVIR